MANIDAIKILGSLLSSGALSRGSGSNILGSVIGAMTGGGGQSQGGGLGGLLGGLLGGGTQSTNTGGGGLGDLLGMAMKQFGAAGQGSSQGMRNDFSPGQNQRQAEEQAGILIKAMINAAKSDGQVDREEQKNIVGKLGEVTQDEVEFVQREMASPLDVEGFVRSIPRGIEQQVYAVSLMTIDLDSNAEAKYLHQLAQGLGMSPEVCNQIHQQLGAPLLYR